MFTKNKRLKQQVSKLRDAFRVEALESRVLLSADPIVGAIQLILPDDTSRDHVALDAYQGDGVTVSLLPAAPTATDQHLAGLAQLADNAGTLSFVPLDASSTIVIGDTSATVSGVQLTNADLAQLGDGYDKIVIGSREGNHVIQIGEIGSGAGVTLNDSLHLINPQQGGEIYINTELNLTGGSSLVIEGSGHTTFFAANTTSADDILINDSVRFNGTGIIVTAGSDGSGNIQVAYGLGQVFQGDLDASIDSAILRAPGNISIGGVVGAASTATGALSGLTIEGVDVGGNIDTPDDVTFSETVTIAGDFTVNASGVVTFAKTVTLTAGGDFTIRGATQVIFMGGVVLNGGGDLFIEANEITFSGGGESVIGTGIMTLRPTTVGLAIEVGSPPNGQSADTLNIDNSEIATFADGFSKIVIGHQTGAHATATAGDVRIGAIGTVEQPTLRENLEVYGGSITVEDYSSPTLNYTLLVNGSIKLDAVDDITLYNQVEARNGMLQNIVLYSESGAIIQANALADGVPSEVLRGASLDARAALGINLLFTELVSVTATNAGISGDIVISETATGADLLITSVSQSNVAGSGGIAVSTAAGNMTVLASGSGVIASGSGAIALTVAGSARSLAVNDVITSGSGSISLSASGSVSTLDDASNDGLVSSGGGAINVVSSLANVNVGGDISSAGGAVSVQAKTSVTMVDGKKISSLNVGDTGAVTLLAGTGMTVSLIEADGTITLTAQNGAITDGLSGTGPNLDGDTATAILSATQGIGAAGLALHTRVATLSAANTTSGGLYVQEATALRLASGGAYAVDLGGSNGNASISTTDGALTVAGAVRSTGSTGQVLLQSGEGSEATAADVAVQANISSSNGSISISAADSIVIDNLTTGAPRVEALAAGQTLDLLAANAIGMEGAAQLATNNGNVRMQAVAGSVALGAVNAGSATISINAGTSVTDALNDDAAAPTVNLAAQNLRILAGSGIGAAGAAVETQVAVMAVQAGGSAYLAEADGVAIGTVGPVSVNRIDSIGATAAVTDLAVTGMSTAGGAGTNIVATGNLVIDSAINAGSGNVRIDVTGALTLNAAIGNGSGSITVLATNNIVQSALGRLITSGGTIDVLSSAGLIVMAEGALAQTNAGNIRYQAASNITLGLLDARSSADRTSGLTTGQFGWGSVSVVSGGAVLDIAADAAADIYANDLRLNAVGAIGAGSEALEIEARRMSSVSAGLFVSDLVDIDVDQTAVITVNRVLADGSIAGSTVTDAAQAGLSSSGALVLQAIAGSITSGSNGAISASGNVLLGAGVDIILTANAGSSGASLSANAGTGIVHFGIVSAAATVDLVAGAIITQAQGSSIATSGGNVSLSAGTFATIETIAAGSGAVRIVAGSSIIEGDASGDTEVDITAGSLQLAAGGGIGDVGDAFETSVAVLSAQTTMGSIHIAETDSVAVGSMTVQVNRVAASGLSAATAHAAQAGATASSGDLVLVAASGNLVTDSAISVSNGSLLLRALAGSVTLNAGVTGSAGALSILATGSITQNAAITSSTSVDVAADGAISMANGALTTATGNVRYAAGTTLGVGSIVSNSAVSLIAASITDTGTTDTDVTASVLRMVATDAIGTASAHLQTAVSTLAFTAGSGGVYLNEADALTISGIGGTGVSRTAIGGLDPFIFDAGLASSSSGGNLVISAAGTIAITTSVTAGGNLLLQASGASSDFILAGALGVAGNASLAAGRDLNVSSLVQTSGAGKTIDLSAGRDIYAAEGSALITNGGNIVLDAARHASFELLDAGSAGVNVRAATGGIYDGDVQGDTEADIVAGSVLLRAGITIGTGLNHVETTATTLSAYSGSAGINVTETNALIVDTVTVQANRVDASGAAVATNYAAQANLQAGGNVILVSNASSLTISDNVTAGAGVLLQSSTGGLIINNAVTSTGGVISLASAGTIAQRADIVTTGGTIDIAAVGTIAMDNGTRISGTSNIRVAAGTVMTLGAITTTGSVSLSASGITDAGNVETDVTASQLRLVTTSVSNTGAGIAGSHLQLAVGTLAVSSAGVGGVYLDEANDIVIGNVSDITVQRFSATGSYSSVVDAAMSDLVSAGNVVLMTTVGAITVNEGDADSTGVSAAGNVLLQAGGVKDIFLNAQLRSSGGNISLGAGQNIVQNTAIVTAQAGKTIDLAAAGAIFMAEGSVSLTSNGNVSLQAGGSAFIESIVAGSGGVRVTASAIVDFDTPGDSEVDIFAGSLQLVANAIGVGSNALETSVAVLSAQAGSGGMYLRETDAVTVDTVAIQVNRVDGRGATAATVNAAQANLAAAGNVVLASGALTISDLVSSSAGSVLLQAAGDMTINDAISAAAGSVSLSAGGAIAQKAGISSAGSIDVVAGAAVSMTDGTTSSAGANVRYAVGGALAIGSIAGLDVSLSAASISDSGSADTDITARELRLVATSGAGSSSAPLTITAGTIAAQVGSLHVNATSDLAIGSVGVIAVNRLATNGSVAQVSDSALAGISSVNEIVLASAGSIVQAGTLATASAGSSVALSAAANITMAQTAISSTNAGSISYSAGSQLTLGLLDARSAADRASGTRAGQSAWGAVVLNAGAGIVDTGAPAVMAGLLDMNASDVGTTGNAFDVEAFTFSADAANLYLADASTLAVSGSGIAASGNAVISTGEAMSLDAAVSAGGNLLLQAAGSMAVNAALTSSAGNISLNAGGAYSQQAAIATLGEGATVDIVTASLLDMAAAASISTVNGAVAIQAGGMTVGAISAGSANVSLVAAAGIADNGAANAKIRAAGLRMHAGEAIGSAANAIDTAVDKLAAHATSGGIVVTDTDGASISAAGVGASANRVGADGTTSVAAVAALAGVSAPAGDIVLSATSGAIAFDLAATGAVGRDLSVIGDAFVVNQPLNGQGGKLLIAPVTASLNIQLGGTSATGNLVIGTGALANLAGGFDSVVIGSGVAGQDIAVSGSAAPVVLRDSLVLNVAGSGSLITLEGQLTAEALEARGAVAVQGAMTVTAGNGAAAGGDIVFKDSVDGTTGNDQLALAAGGDSVVFAGPVGAATALASLTINDAANVTFSQAVTVKGDVVINASGVVRFDSLLTLDSGSLIIRGATEVIIGDVVFHSTNGQFVVEANMLTLQGDVVGVKDAVLRPSDASLDIVVGGSVAGAFNISSAMLQHLSGADSLVIGVQGGDGHAAAGAGKVTLAPLDFGAFTAAPVKVFGTSITLAAGSGSLSASSFSLDARAGVILEDSVTASAGDIVIYSASGAVTMSAGTALTATNAVVLDAAGALGVALITAEHAVLRSASGGIVDVNGDTAVNVVADTVSLYGYGSLVGSGNPIEVQSPAIYLAAPTGVEVQETSPDGRTHFYLLDGAAMYEQAVGIGQVVRHTADPTPASVPEASAPVSGAFAATAPAAPVFQFVAPADAGSMVASYLAGTAGVGRAAAGTLSASALGLGKAPAAVELEFDQWLQDLVI